jgi:hypothetical protein
MEATEFLEGVGHATSCQLGKQGRSHTALRFVWHHILPQACGGKTEPANLASLCDNCHYSVHILMWYMANGGVPATVKGTTAQTALANVGYGLAVAAGTAGKMPKEAGVG